MIGTCEAASMRTLHKIARWLAQLLYWWFQSWHSGDFGDRFKCNHQAYVAELIGLFYSSCC